MCYSMYTDMSPGWQRKPHFRLLLPDILSLLAPVPLDIKFSFTWRPDYVSFNGTYDGEAVTLGVGYHANDTVCAKYTFAAASTPRTVSFTGAPPNPHQTAFEANAFAARYHTYGLLSLSLGE